jgi:hypothetical protein
MTAKGLGADDEKPLRKCEMQTTGDKSKKAKATDERK